MAFNLRSLKKNININQDSLSTSEGVVDRILVIDNWIGLFSVLKNESLEQLKNTKILTTRGFSFRDLLNPWLNGPSLVRESQSLALSTNCGNKYFSTSNLKPSLFVKDGEIYSFESRAKPYEILPNEDYFIQGGINLDLQIFLDKLTSSDWIEWLDLNTTLVMINQISRNDDRWIISTANGQHFNCKELIWNLPFKQLIKLATDAPFSLEARTIAQSQNLVSAFLLGIETRLPVCDARHTFLIPQSYTHTWGNFIVESGQEFKPNTPWFKCLFFPKIEENNEDVILQKIKLLKRSLNKLFPLLEKNLVKENYHIELNYASISIQESILPTIDQTWMQSANLVLLNGEFDKLGNTATNFSQFVENGFENSFN
ncbi:MAG: hypothetical protein QE271_05640 [Bacteriovoracaceae bacterium]|nr:hypothetical protein [Bacteriovoracaceae bacterium]